MSAADLAQGLIDRNGMGAHAVDHPDWHFELTHPSHPESPLHVTGNGQKVRFSHHYAAADMLQPHDGRAVQFSVGPDGSLTHDLRDGANSQDHITRDLNKMQGFARFGLPVGTSHNLSIPDPEFEQKHPRGQGGRFTNKPGGADGAGGDSRVPDDLQQVANDNPDRIKIVRPGNPNAGSGTRPAPQGQQTQQGQDAPEPRQPEEAPQSGSGAPVTGSGAPTTKNGGDPERVAQHITLARAILGHLEQGDTREGFSRNLGWRELTGMANDAFGGDALSGKYDARDVYDAMEVAVNQYIVNHYPNLFEMPTEEALAKLEALENRLPTQTNKTDTQIELQQFSTPPREAYAAIRALGDIRGLKALEPSAGTGSLANMMRLAGADVTCNEYHLAGGDVRAGLLAAQGFRVTRRDAEILASLADPGEKYDIVGMNPPFSSTGGRAKSHKTKYGGMHVEAAAWMLHPGGRLVAIVGGGMSQDSSHAPWFNRMRQHFSQKANLLVDGECYKKWGTEFNNRVLVFDKPQAGEKPNSLSCVTSDNPATVDSVARTMGELGDGRRNIERSLFDDSGAGGASAGGATQTGQNGASDDAPVASGGSVPGLAGGNGNLPGGRTGGGNGGQYGGTRPRAPRGGTRPNSGAGSPQGNDSAGGDQATPSVLGGGPTSLLIPPDLQQDSGAQPGDSDMERLANQVRAVPSHGATVAPSESSNDDDIFTIYKPEITFGFPHHTAMVETGAMAGVSTPLAHMSEEQLGELCHFTNEDLKPKWSESKNRMDAPLTDPALEAILLAQMRHETVLPDGTRAGFLVGDGTGTGKGRVSAGIIWHNWKQGNKRAVWVSKNPDLRGDAERDLSETVGWKVKPTGNKKGITNIPIVKHSDVIKKEKDEAGNTLYPPISMGDGVIFISYNSLWRDGTMARLQQWLSEGKKDDGSPADPVMLFDESHMAQGAAPGDDRADPTKAGAAVLEFQKNLPKARVTYLSATMADKPENMGYMTRLGLWGSGNHFQDFPEFCSFVNRAGVASMELVARELKANGTFVSRSLGMANPDGTPISFSEEKVELFPEQIEQYNKSAELWRSLLDKVKEEQEAGNLDKSEVARFNSRYWGAHIMFFKGLISAIKAPHLISLNERLIAEGKSPVNFLSQTNASSMQRAIGAANQAGLGIDEVDLTNKEMIFNFINEHWPVQQTQEVLNPETNRNEQALVWRYTTDDGRNFTVPHNHPYAVGQELPDGRGAKITSVEPVQDAAKLRVREEIMRKAEEVSIPAGLLDQFTWHFGPEAIAEQTSRATKTIINPETGKLEVVTRTKPKGYENYDSIKTAECRQFNEGKRSLAIVSGSGSTGISLHCDKSFPNQNQRTGIIAEVSFNAKEDLQKLGRIHRTGQVKGPEFILVSTPIGGERRYTGAMASKLAASGAMQRGDRGSANAGELAKYDYNSKYGEAAIHRTLAAMEDNHRVMMGREDMSDWMELPRAKLLDQFFNRILCLPLDVQDRYMEIFDRNFSTAIEAAKERGELNAVQDIRAHKIRTDKKQVVYKDPNTGSVTHLHTLVGTFKNTRVFSGVDGNRGFDANGEMQEHLGDSWHAGGTVGKFMRNTRGRIAWAVPVKKMNTQTWLEDDAYQLIYPNGRKETKLVSEVQGWQPLHRNVEQFGTSFLNRVILHHDNEGTPLPENGKTFAEVWDEQAKNLPESEEKPIYLLSGQTLPVMRSISGGSRVVRVTPNNEDGTPGTRIVGLQLDPENIHQTMNNLGMMELNRSDATSVYFGALGAMTGRDAIQLLPDLNGNRYEIRLGTHQSSKGLKVTRPDGGRLLPEDVKRFQDLGLKMVKVGGYEWQAFIPKDDRLGPAALEKLLEKFPVQNFPEGMQSMEKGGHWLYLHGATVLIKSLAPDPFRLPAVRVPERLVGLLPEVAGGVKWHI